MKAKNIFGAITLVVIGVVFGTLLVTGFGWVRPGFADIKLGTQSPPVEVDAQAQAFNSAFIKVAEQVTPSIVAITVTSDMPDNDAHRFFFPDHDFQMPEMQRGSGSGIIIREDGYILTNNHVVENASEVTVNLYDKREVKAEVIGTDPLTDLAVIKINETGLPAVYLGDSDSIKVGQWVMAIGNPFSLNSTVTAGIISALNRGQLRLIQDSYGVEDFIQTDAVINPGNSGGALVDLSGAVIGVNTAIYSRSGAYIGYGFAIPINLARNVAADLIAHGKINRGYIGVMIREVDDDIAEALGMEKPTGVIIDGVVPNGSASEEDIQPGDIILKIDGIEMNQPNQLQSYVASKLAGDEVTLLLYRNGDEIERTVTLKPREDENEVEPAVDKRKDDNPESLPQTESYTDIGLTVENLSRQEMEQFSVKNGILITKVEAYSKAYDQGLFRGLVITSVNNKPLNSVAEFTEILEERRGNAILLGIQDREGNSRFIGLKIPE